MKVGYPCINRSIGCTSARTFRLASYTDKRLLDTVAVNIDCLERVLRWNVEHGIGFFRLTSDLVPFASHPVCRADWAGHFHRRFRAIGRFIRQHGLRISMHPDQFVLLNAPNKKIVQSSIRELEYHCRILDLMALPATAKVQIHIGGAYGDKAASMARFVERYRKLSPTVRRRLVIENDDRCYTVADCLEVSRTTKVPVLFDVLHHKLNSSGESLRTALAACARTWRRRDGVPMVDYSSPEPGQRRGRHAEHIARADFRRFLGEVRGLDFDVMLEIKDKEKSALAALRVCAGARTLVPRFTATRGTAS